jgi:hypothetical protein
MRRSRTAGAVFDFFTLNTRTGGSFSRLFSLWMQFDATMKDKALSWPGTRNRNWFRVPVFVLALSFASFALNAQSPVHVEVTDLDARDLLQRFYFENLPQPSATLRVNWIHKDFERRGFFRIGLLPLVALEEFQLEIPRPELAADSFGQLQSWLKSTHGGHRLELRKVSLVIGKATPCRLACGRIRFNPTGEWELLDGVSLLAGTNEIRAASASLRVNGAEAGRLILKESAPVNFFSANRNLRMLTKESSP